MEMHELEEIVAPLFIREGELAFSEIPGTKQGSVIVGEKKFIVKINCTFGIIEASDNLWRYLNTILEKKMPKKRLQLNFSGTANYQYRIID